MTTESMRVAKLITEDNLGDPISISGVIKICTSLISEATDVANSINHFQGRSEYKIDSPSLTEGIHKVPDGFYQDEREFLLECSLSSTMNIEICIISFFRLGW